MYSLRFQTIVPIFIVTLLAMHPSLAQEAWDLHYTGDGDPTSVLTDSFGVTGSTYNFDAKFTTPGLFPSWLTANGNPGGLLAQNFATNTQAGGWTAEWTFQAHPTAPLPTTDVLRFGDDTSQVNVRYQDGQVQLFDSFGNSSSAYSLDVRVEQTYRLVRQPGQDSVELYVNYGNTPALSFTPSAGGSLSQIAAAPSQFESAWDSIRYHSGATLPQSAPTGLYIPTQVQHTAGKAYTVNPAINNQAVLSGHDLPDLWKQGDTIKIMAARGEYEPATFVLNTETPLQAVNVEIGELTGEAGTLPADTLDVRVAQPYFMRVTNWPAEVPWVLTHDPGLFTIVDEPQPWVEDLPPDAIESNKAYIRSNLLTRAAIDTDMLQSADVDERQQFWITAHIPESAAPGTYTAPIHVVSANGEPMDLTLEVRVPNFELRQPDFEYSVYYPAHLEGTVSPSNLDPHLSETQYVNEIKNMVAHGLTNPNFYEDVDVNPDGSLDFTNLEHLISLREQAGIDYQGRPLYISDNPLLIVQRDLTPEEYAQNVTYASQIVAWAQSKGFGDVYFVANDESSNGQLLAQRDSFQSVHDGGGKIWASVLNSGYYDVVGDLVDRPVLIFPGMIPWDQQAESITAEEFLLNGDDMAAAFFDPALMMTPEIQAAIEGSHANGYGVFTYQDPVGGMPLPEAHRRLRGLGLWLAGLDGTMTWAYTHNRHNDITFSEFDPETDWLPDLIASLVFRGEEAPFDTLAWEAFREGVDDARYLATLLAALEQADANEHADLIADTQQWLASLSTDTDLDAMRLEMAWRIEVLTPLSVPEPGSLSLMVLVALLILRRNRALIPHGAMSMGSIVRRTNRSRDQG